MDRAGLVQSHRLGLLAVQHSTGGQVVERVGVEVTEQRHGQEIRVVTPGHRLGRHNSMVGRQVVPRRRLQQGRAVMAAMVTRYPRQDQMRLAAVLVAVLADQVERPAVTAGTVAMAVCMAAEQAAVAVQSTDQRAVRAGMAGRVLWRW